MPDRKSWSVQGDSIHQELVEILSLSSEEIAALTALQAPAKTQAPLMVEEFYQRLFAHENTKEYFAEASMERLHSMIADWFTELFSGSYDTAYAKKRMGIGQLHVRIGLPVRYPLAMLDIVGKHGDIISAQGANPELAKTAFHKVLAIDVAVFNQAYENSQLEHLADLVGGERLARLLLSGGESIS